MSTAEEQYQKGIDQLRNAKYKEALQIFNSLIKEFPENADYFSERGVIYYHLKDKKRSLADMDEAVRLQPKKSYRYSSRAYIRGHFKMIDLAIADYRKAVELDPEDAIAHNNLGLLEEQIGYQDKAVEHFNIADELMEDDNSIPDYQSEQEELAAEDSSEKVSSSIWNELRSLSTKEGRASFRRFLQSGFKKT